MAVKTIQRAEKPKRKGNGWGGRRRNSGRPKGTFKRWKPKMENFILEGAHKGELPLDFMLRVMQNPACPMFLQLELAKICAPYKHPKLQSVQHSGDPNNPVHTVGRIERVVVDPTDSDSQLENATDQNGTGLPTTH
jgi:hypothetical protein